MPRTSERLEIFHNGTSTPGLLFYGLGSGRADEVAAHVALEIPDAVEVSPSALSGLGWTVDLWSVALRSMPDERRWQDLVLSMLDRIIDAGYRIAWLGVEGGFVDPPHLFQPQMATFVLAARTQDGFTVVPAPLDQVSAPLDDADLAALVNASGGMTTGAV